MAIRMPQIRHSHKWACPGSPYARDSHVPPLCIWPLPGLLPNAPMAKRVWHAVGTAVPNGRACPAGRGRKSSACPVQCLCPDSGELPHSRMASAAHWRIPQTPRSTGRGHAPEFTWIGLPDMDRYPTMSACIRRRKGIAFKHALNKGRQHNTGLLRAFAWASVWARVRAHRRATGCATALGPH